MPRGAQLAGAGPVQGCLDVGCIALSLGLSTLPAGVALTGDGHWQVGLEGASLRGQTAGGVPSGGSTAQIWDCPRTWASMSPKPLFTLGRGCGWLGVTHPAPKGSLWEHFPITETMA